jgi:hypothetical protein
MCRRGEPFLVTIRNVFRVVFRVFLFQLILITSGLGQDASTGALRGVVLDAQGAVITNADIVAIRVETGIRGSIRRGPRRKGCRPRFRR